MRTVAVVVTYNRVDMLRYTIQSLLEQQASCDILVVDNASTDSTESLMRSYVNEYEGIKYHRLDSNLGGAGGFNAGIRLAVEADYDYIWIMDDDCQPKTDALTELLMAAECLDNQFGWLSSVALWTDGKECKMNRQKLRKSFYDYSHLLKESLVQAEQATFVSLFLSSKIVKMVGLPISDFFIWGDDIEYTRRIAVRYNLPSFVVGKSQVIHAMESNVGSNITNDVESRIPRYYYAYRNEGYLYRQEGLRGICYYVAKFGYHMLKVLRYSENRKIARLKVMGKGLIDGLGFNPPVEFVRKRV